MSQELEGAWGQKLMQVTCRIILPVLSKILGSILFSSFYKWVIITNWESKKLSNVLPGQFKYPCRWPSKTKLLRFWPLSFWPSLLLALERPFSHSDLGLVIQDCSSLEIINSNVLSSPQFHRSCRGRALSYLLSLPTEIIFCILKVLKICVYFALNCTGMFLVPLLKG